MLAATNEPVSTPTFTCALGGNDRNHETQEYAGDCGMDPGGADECPRTLSGKERGRGMPSLAAAKAVQHFR